MARRHSTGSLVLGAVLVTAAVYAGYRYLEKDKKRGVRVGIGARGFVDYANDADARSDKRPYGLMYLVKPYQIFNPGGGIRPFEIDAQGQPTNRPLILPGEPPQAGGVVVSGQSGPAIVGGQSGPAIVGGQSGPAIVGGQSGPAIVGGQSGPAIVGHGWGHDFGHHDFGRGGFGHDPRLEHRDRDRHVEAFVGRYGHHFHHPHYAPPPMMDPNAPQM